MYNKKTTPINNLNVEKDNIEGYYSDNKSIFIKKSQEKDGYLIIMVKIDNSRPALVKVDDISYLGSFENRENITGNIVDGLEFHIKNIIVFISEQDYKETLAEIDW